MRSTAAHKTIDMASLVRDSKHMSSGVNHELVKLPIGQSRKKVENGNWSHFQVRDPQRITYSNAEYRILSK